MSICNFKLQIGEVECIDAQVKLFLIHLYSTSISLLQYIILHISKI